MVQWIKKNQYKVRMHVIIHIPFRMSIAHIGSIWNFSFTTMKRSSCLSLPLLFVAVPIKKSHDSCCTGSQQPFKSKFTVLPLRKFDPPLRKICWTSNCDSFVLKTSILSKLITGQEGETDAVGIHFAPSATSVPVPQTKHLVGAIKAMPMPGYAWSKCPVPRGIGDV